MLGSANFVSLRVSSLSGFRSRVDGFGAFQARLVRESGMALPKSQLLNFPNPDLLNLGLSACARKGRVVSPAKEPFDLQAIESLIAARVSPSPERAVLADLSARLHSGSRL